MASRKFYVRAEEHDELDSLEEEDPIDSYLVLDAVDAEWRGFLESQWFSLNINVESDGQRARDYWLALFSGDGPPEDPFESMDTAQLVLPPRLIPAELLRENTWFEVLVDDAVDGGVQLHLNNGTNDEIVTRAAISDWGPSSNAQVLDAIFDMSSWPRADRQQIERALGKGPVSTTLIALDVGQGSANALVGTDGRPHVYFDVGRGGQNYRGIKFCTCAKPTIVLSHWDTDHWLGVRSDASLLTATWIVPIQQLGPTQTRLANDILRARGAILVNPFKSVSAVVARPAHWSYGYGANQSLEILKCTGTNRNDSGQALKVDDNNRDLSWLLTGDAAYDVIPTGSHSHPLSALTVSHHGAEQTRHASIPPRRQRNGYARLIYSFGHANRWNHPRAGAVWLHKNQGWLHQLGWDDGKEPGIAAASGDVLATNAVNTPANPSSVAAGWKRRPLVPHHLQQCIPGFQIRR